MKDYYKILEVSEKATAEEIKSSYRKLALKYHPDKNPGNTSAEAKIKEINEAYGILGNPNKRAQYDASRHFGSSRGGNPFGGGFDPMSDFDAIFQEIFRTQQRRQNRVVQVLAELTMEEMDKGVTFKFTYNNKTYRIKVPSGLEEGSVLEVALDDGRIGQIIIQCKPHEFLERDYFDLYVELPLSFGELLKGLDVELTILTQKISVAIPPNLKYGSLLRIKGQGLFNRGETSRGDLFLRLTPKKHNLTQEQIDKIVKMEKENPVSDPPYVSRKKLNK